MWRYVFVTVALSLGLFVLDYYVYRNWRHFARYRRWPLRWSVHVYRVFMVLMPLMLPLYFSFSRWWEVEPKLPRFLFFAVWTVYYLPKVLLALALGLKDLAKASTSLFRWFQDRLRPANEPAAPPEQPKERLDLSDMRTMTRGEFLTRMGWSLASIPYVVIGYSVFRSLYDFEVQRSIVPLKNLPRALDGLTIAHVSDLHAGSFFSDRPMLEAVQIVNGLKPDVIAVTGDYVNHDAAEASIILPALRQLKADVGVFGCLGNHDHYARVPDVVERIRTTPIDLLINEHRTIHVDGVRLHVIGTDNTGFNQHYADLPRAVEGIEETAPGEEIRLLLAHDPTFWDHYVRPGYPEIDLMLCGHTHGGQIGFEFGPFRWGLAHIMYERWAGLYTEPRSSGDGQQYLYVNRGLGTVGPPIRLGMRPEVTLITLRRA